MLSETLKNDKFRDQRGFTLIEIIAVLVILAVLAVVAVPKYFSLIADSKNKAAMQAVAEGIARVNNAVGSYMLANAGNLPTTVGTLDSSAGDFTITYGTLASNTIGITANGAAGGGAAGASASGVARLPST
jgi:prepilin-type N-terminal cleavage/methylation domain-containing protein